MIVQNYKLYYSMFVNINGISKLLDKAVFDVVNSHTTSNLNSYISKILLSITYFTLY